MKKLFLFFILAAGFAVTSCGGKNMDETPDGSGTGPKYYNEGEKHHPSKKADAESETDSLKRVK